MKIITKASSAQRLASKIRCENKTIGFVPTMGYLHEGHISLINIARKKADVVFVSIYVNPLQFGPSEDLKKYPRDLKRDEKLCREAGVDYIFYPSDSEMYSDEYSTYVNVENITDILEGKVRPGHFKGVTTVCLKLFNIVQPHFSVFGQKDAQQLAVIKKMVHELNLDMKVITGETKREPDGLAMSSRNVYLNDEQRKDASVLYKALQYAKRKIEEGYNRDIDFLSHQMYKLIKSRPRVTNIDYISFNDSENLKTYKSFKEIAKNKEITVSLAVRFGKIRLIDNISIKC
ncbi:MAG: pantoate--beta-alanine ligase [Ignavibacteriae bacterium]|nr:MAG: pantoate--beta-alanine ligase [Ignavibacteriota bacterium]